MSGADFHFCARPFRTSSYNTSQRRLSRHVLLKIYINLSFRQFIRNRLDRRWYPLDKTSCVCVCVCVGGGCPKARQGQCGEEKNLCPPGIEAPFLGCPTNSLSLKALIQNKTKVNERIKKNSVALVRERTIPTERPPPVGEVSANFCG